MTQVSRRNTRPKTTSHGQSPNYDNTNRFPVTRPRRAFTPLLFSTFTILILLIFIGFYFTNSSINPANDTVKPRVVTPLPSPKLMDLPMVNFNIQMRYLIRVFSSSYKWLNLPCSFKGSTRRLCIGEHIGLMFILESVRGKLY